MGTEKMQPTNPLATVSNVLDMLQKAKGTTTTQSTTSNLTNEGAMGLINQILQSTQGLAAVSQGQKSAGMYNSTVNQQMINDLLTQTASKVASQQQGSTTTTKTSGAIGKGDAGNAAKILAALQGANQLKGLLNPLVSKIGDKYGVKSVEDIGSKLADMVMGGEATPGEVMAATDWNGNAGTDSLDVAQWEQAGNSATSGLESLGASISSGAESSTVDLSSFMSSPDSSAAEAVTDWNGNTNGTTLSNDEWDQMGSDATNFSAGSNASASSGASTNYGSYLKIADYIDKPKKRGNIFDFSDGDWKDDIGDITDAISIFYPPAAFARSAMEYSDAGVSFAVDFYNDPGQAMQDVADGDRLTGNLMVDATTQGIKAGETIGNAVGDVVESIGDLFGW